MQSPIWVLPGPFPHRGNAHPVTCDRRKFRKVVIWVLVVIAQPVLCHSVGLSNGLMACGNTLLTPKYLVRGRGSQLCESGT
jgi:hypothetical protein